MPRKARHRFNPQVLTTIHLEIRARIRDTGGPSQWPTSAGVMLSVSLLPQKIV